MLEFIDLVVRGLKVVCENDKLYVHCPTVCKRNVRYLVDFCTEEVGVKFEFHVHGSLYNDAVLAAAAAVRPVA